MDLQLLQLINDYYYLIYQCTGIGALLGAAVTIGAALIFGDDKKETKNETEKATIPPPLSTPTNIIL